MFTHSVFSTLLPSTTKYDEWLCFSGCLPVNMGYPMVSGPRSFPGGYPVVPILVWSYPKSSPGCCPGGTPG